MDGARGDAIVAVAVFVVLIAAGVYDLVAAFSGGRVAPASDAVLRWSQQWPILPFLAGILCGHLFFPQVTLGPTPRP